MDELLVAVTLALQWSERLAKLNQLIVDHRRTGVPIDIGVLQAEDDQARDAFQKLIDAKKAQP